MPYINLGCLTSNLDTKVCVSQQAFLIDTVLLLGQQVVGKSWTISKLIENMVNNKSKVILLDPTGEYSVLENGVQSVSIGKNAFSPMSI